ncbi:MAG: chromosome partitioning protein ParB [Actinobacteria bacterium]|nr:MAG: chromosome partitioning protein ParB [Actinomycetota bacterium]MDO8949790.1 ParB/RepB/Spo0J family partition protein [Actinomycetota bacterium]
MTKRGLGRGLSALIPGAGHEFVGGEPQELPIDFISPNPNQPRTAMDADQIDELSDSIGKVGVLQPIIVRPHAEGYQIIAGERRWRAAKAAGLTKVPVRVMASTETEALALALIENLQRQDLNAIEEARGYRRLIAEYGMTQAELADRVSKSRSAVTNTLRLLDLPEDVQELMYANKLTAGHARAVLSLTDEAQRIRLAHRIVDEGLSVRDAENLARLIAAGQGERTPRPISPKSYKVVARKLRRLLSTTVRVRQTVKKGKIEIDFTDEGDLERIFRVLTESGVAEEADTE